jgi:benzoyl-CoA reductase/2-hydroxyglutaryl-CoA dehydratase subunit BcrC/BadD/HgdB
VPIINPTIASTTDNYNIDDYDDVVDEIEKFIPNKITDYKIRRYKAKNNKQKRQQSISKQKPQ